VIAGIDVGIKGAIGLLYPVGKSYVYDMPAFAKEVNGAALAGIFREFRPDHVYIEAVNSFNMGRQSSFNFGQGVGVIKGVLSTLGIPFTPVSPSKWKKTFNLGKDKSESRAAATRLFPDLASEFARKKDDGRAEAILIAKWGENQSG
jgi:Holliday junction resolvasome RuvABC endonuclease subunit